MAGVRVSRLATSGLLQAHALVERTVPYWPANQIRRRQRMRLRRLVDHAYRTVPFYREVMDARGLRPGDFQQVDDLQRLPLIDAAYVQENRERFLSTAYSEGDCQTSYTSGTESGVRRAVVWDSRTVLHVVAYLERLQPIIDRLAGEPPAARALRATIGDARAQSLRRRVGRESRILLISPGDNPNRTREGLHSRRTLMPVHSQHLHYVSSRLPMESIVPRLDAIRPRIVASFGSVAEQFFRHLHESGARPALPRVWSYTGDGVSDAGRELAASFGCSLHSSYNVTEIGRIGFQCERVAGHHLNVDLAPVRVIDTAGRPVPRGEPGELVASGLRNRAMVLLNYRLGDQGTLAEEACGCGRTLPLLELLEGRRSTLMRLGDGRELSALTLEAMFRVQLGPTRKVQLVERGAGDLLWRIVPFSNVSQSELREALADRANEVLGPDTNLTIEFVDDIPATEGGKLRRALKV